MVEYRTTELDSIDQAELANDIADAFILEDRLEPEASDNGKTFAASLAAWGAWLGVRHAAADSSSGSGFWSAYSGQFVSQMVAAFVIALVCNAFWKIPLYQVVDVNLALSLSYLALVIAALSIIFFLELANMMWRGALETIFYISTAAFLPFGLVLGFMIYAGLSSQEATSGSVVYKTYVGLFGTAYTWLASITGDMFGLIKETKNTAGEIIKQVNTDMLKVWVPILAGAATVANVVRDFVRSSAAQAAYA